MKKILDFCEKYAPEIFVILVCLPALVNLRTIDSYHTSFYFTDFSTGFGGKKLLGEICSLWLPELVRKRHILPLIVSVTLLMIGLFAWFNGQCLRRQKDNRLFFVSGLVLLVIYLFSPYSFQGLITGACVDFYLCTATLCFLYLFMRHRGKWFYYLGTLVLVCLACLTHHIFCNIYFPLIFAVFIYDIFTDKENRTKNLILYSFITLVLFGLFCAIVFWGKMNVDFKTYCSYLQTRSETINALSWNSAIYYEYYAKLSEHVVAYIIPMWKYNIARFLLTLLVFSPLFVMFLSPWILAVKNAKTKTEKWCYCLMQLALHLIILPAYIMAVDYQRWTYAYLFSQFCISGLMLYMNDAIFIEQCNKIAQFVLQYKLIFCLLAIYICSFPLVTSCTAAPLVDIICECFGLGFKTNEVLPM